ncbi:hypothetical protein Cantr_09960 [Candida viswanathii]|uniref:BED-type domain-containing protein n=1 Tax=Candida viswanathii TaxID=5486 RepID=A0A367YB00_9ASCO|nr:hypothetical protein Cantr_09960 [Candida viswanathii]
MMSFAYNSPVPIVTPFPFMYSYRDRNPNAILPPGASSSSATTSPPQQPLQQVQLKQPPPQTQQLLSAVEHHAQERNQQLQQQSQLDAAVRLHQLRNSQPTPPKLPSVEPSPPQLAQQLQQHQHDNKLVPQLPPLTPQLAAPALHQAGANATTTTTPQHLHQSPTSPLAQPLRHSPFSPDESVGNTHNNRPKRKNRPGKKFGAKKRSWVWTWFDQDSADPNVAGCNYCGKIIIRLASDKGSPKKLNEHLKTHKIDINSINYARTPHIDGHGITYSNSGQPLDYPPNFRTFRVNENNNSNHHHHHHEDTNSETSGDETHNHNNNSSTRVDLDNNRRFLSSEFDNSPYTPMKFRTHLLKFLTENKLPISVIKSNSFKQLIYDLRSDSVSDLTELTGMYSTLIEVSRFSKDKHDEDHMTDALAEQLVNHVESSLQNQKNQNNQNNTDATPVNDTLSNNSTNDTAADGEALDLKMEVDDNSSEQ